MLRETAKRIATLYGCFRSNPSSGYPRRTIQAEQALFGGLDEISDRVSYVTELTNGLHSICDNALKLNKTKFKEQLLEDTAITGDLSYYCDDTDVIERALFPSERHPEVWSLKETTSHPTSPHNSLIILALDEARELFKPVEKIGISRFRLLRSALRSFSKDIQTSIYNLIAVFVDTNTKIHNFVPYSRMTTLQEKVKS